MTAAPVALIAGSGALPAAVAAALAKTGHEVILCRLEGQPGPAVLTFRLETLGTLIASLRARGVTGICMAGAVTRPTIDPDAIDAATAPLVPRLRAALALGDDGALRTVIALFEEVGFAVHAAHEIAPGLLAPRGWRAGPGVIDAADLAAARAGHADLSRGDVGQAVVVRAGRVVATEGPRGTDAMLASLGAGAAGGLLYKAPKTGQDRRADLPAIGPDTVRGAIRAGLSAIAVEAGGVFLLDRPTLEDRARDASLTLRAVDP